MSWWHYTLEDEPYKDQYFNFDIEKTMTVLSEKRCIPCKGGVPPLEKKEIDKLLTELQNEWQVNELGHYKKYKFSNFIKAMEFANRITEIAEQKHIIPI
ncbi:Putative pterin-4-alpha-carbinolamine dehydratase [Rickettsia monacensis]|uniref:4a-hydroxytetrahydrobiopterin dehydratase n=1 Tax=Rickettsia monacensis TaxID=109232 RepID=A0A0B7IZ16_9RICK|nr:pterin-4-alpha-carbinolamine dehydratase [Rickettsia monacensis IrR/Munich]CEO17167.1 Putative pterin-4-alpha-carbinolamine dehydratase [Rickettsia monacensis]